MIAVYIRVSTYEQNLAAQRAEIQLWLDAHQYSPDRVRWFEDKQTGKSLQRPGFENLQHAIFAGEIDTVVVWKLDRLARSLRDGVEVMTDWIKKKIRLVSVTQQIDLSGVFGQMIGGILFAIAEMELNTMKERQAAGIAVAKQKGVYKGRKPKSTKAKPERARQLKANGLTPVEIASALGVSVPTVFRYLAH